MASSETEPLPDEPIELEPPSGLPLTVDDRPVMAVPPPVWVSAVMDVTLPTPSKAVDLLKPFYVDLLQFDPCADPATFKAENCRLRFEPAEDRRPIERHEARPLGIEIASLALVERLLVEAEIEYTRERDITTGVKSLILQDPAGNWIELTERRVVG